MDNDNWELEEIQESINEPIFNFDYPEEFPMEFPAKIIEPTEGSDCKNKKKRTRVKWTQNEDKLLIELVGYYGEDWNAIA